MRTLLYLSNKEYVNDMNVDLSEIPSKITLDYLAGLVKDMRHQQRRYFATRDKSVLELSKKAEAKVDAVIEKIYDKQLKLF